MRFFISAILSLTLTLLASCTKDDEVSIAGRWTLIEAYSRLEANSQGILNGVENTYLEGEVIMELQPDGSLTQVGTAVFETILFFIEEGVSERFPTTTQVPYDITSTYTAADGVFNANLVNPAGTGTNSIIAANVDEPVATYTVSDDVLTIDLPAYRVILNNSGGQGTSPGTNESLLRYRRL